MAESGVIEGGRWLNAIESRPWGWFGAFLGLAALLIAGMLAWWAVFGFWDTLFDPAEPLGFSFDGRNHLTLAVLLAFVASGTLWARRGVLHDIQRLGRLAGVGAAELAEAVGRNQRLPRLARGVVVAGSLVLGVAIIPLSQGEDVSSLAAWDMHYVWAVASNVSLFFLLFESAWLTLQGWRTISRYATTHLAVDLLDRQTITSIGRVGLRGAVIWLGSSIIASSLTWGMTQIAPLLMFLALSLTFATLSLLLPAHIARASLREAKHAELDRTRAKIAHARDTLFSGASSDAALQAALLPGLLAYEARIESVPEWPYDTSTLVRFALLSVIAAGSWLGGALVERAVGAVLD